MRSYLLLLHIQTLRREPAPDSNIIMALAILRVNRTANEQYNRTRGGVTNTFAVQAVPVYASAPPMAAMEVIKREY